MGACVSSSSQPVADVQAKERSDEIDSQIKADHERLKKECKILLLGECSFGRRSTPCAVHARVVPLSCVRD